MRSRRVAVVVVVAVVACLAGCVDKAAEAKKRADAQKAQFDAEARAQAAADAKAAKQELDDVTAGCDGGNAAKCVDLGKLTKDPAQRVAVYAKACAMKSKDGCRQAAITASDGKKKLAFFTSLCDLSDVDGCIEGAKLADLLVKNNQLDEPSASKKPQERPAMQLLKKACGYGGAIACTARGVGLANDDPAGAVDAFSKGCDLGEPTSCMQLAQLYKAGKGMKKKDDKKAAELMKKACDKGLKDAC